MPRGVKKGTRRGRYKTLGGAVPATPSVPEKNLEMDVLLDRLRDESPMKFPAAKELAVRTVRMLVRESTRLEAACASNTITAEEAKQINANASNLRRWYEVLGVTQHRDPEEGDEL